MIKNVEIYFHVVDQNVLKSIRMNVPNAFRRPIANFRHANLTLKSPTNSVVNTLRLAPINLKTSIAIALVSVPLFGVLLHYLWMRQRFKRHSTGEKVRALPKFTEKRT